MHFDPVESVRIHVGISLLERAQVDEGGAVVEEFAGKEKVDSLEEVKGVAEVRSPVAFESWEIDDSILVGEEFKFDQAVGVGYEWEPKLHIQARTR